jgi:DNA-binding NarL/FixJ family response regulator
MNQALLVDDHPLIRQALRNVLRAAQSRLTITEAETLASARAILATNPGIDLILLDMQLPDCDGFEGLLSLRSDYPRIPVVIVSANLDDGVAGRALAFGAAGYIPKSSTCSDIDRAVKAALSGQFWSPLPGTPTTNSTHIDLIKSLSPAQLRILMSLNRGMSNKQIAHKMNLTEGTVKGYTTALYRKLGVSSRTQAVILAHEVLVHPIEH